MAQIFIKGVQEPIEVSDSEFDAEMLAELSNNKPNELIQIGSNYFKAGQIKGIQTEKEYKKQTPIYEMTTQELKNIVGDWEEKMVEFKTTQKVDNKILGCGSRQGLVDFYIKAGAIVDQGNGYWAIANIKVYEELEKKCSALSELQRRRKYAETKEREAFDSM